MLLAVGLLALSGAVVSGPAPGPAAPAPPESAAAVAPEEPLPEIGDLLRRTLRSQKASERRLDSYTFDQSEETLTYRSDGSLKETTRRLFYVLSGPEPDSGSRELAEVDGRPATPDEIRKAAEHDRKDRKRRLEARAAAKVSEPARVGGDDDDPEIGSRRLSDLMRRLAIRVTGKEELDGRAAWAVEFSPQPGAPENGLSDRSHPLRLYYLGPMFRYERMQHGRYRQFSQIGLELIGADTPLADAEVLAAMHEFFLRLGFSDLVIHLNNLGDPEDRLRYQEAIRTALAPRRAELCSDCQRRLDENPLRILDCKVPSCQVVAADVPAVDDVAGEASRRHVAQVEAHLGRLGIPYVRNHRLVRGLDYYLRTVFEVISPKLGANTVLCGGGRYDRLIADLGGPAIPGVGFAIGEDRLIEVLPARFREAVLSQPKLYLVPIGEAAQERVLELARDWVREGVPVEIEVSGRSLKAALKRADREGFRVVAMLGDDELRAGLVSVRDLTAGSQSTLQFAALPPWWRELIGRSAGDR